MLDSSCEFETGCFMKKYIKYFALSLVFLALFFTFCNSPKHLSKTINIDTSVDSEDAVEKLREEYNNEDIIGIIKIVGTDINEVLVQANDNKYYLSHDLYKNNDIYGSVFLDHRCSKDSKKMLIFGHNDFKDKTPFSNLENYMSRDYFKDNQFIEILIDDVKMKYQIFSVYIETSDFTYMNLKIDDNTYNNDLVKYKNNSLYDTGVDVDSDDRILILQTCSNHKDYQKFKDKYLLIIAKLVQ